MAKNAIQEKIENKTAFDGGKDAAGKTRTYFSTNELIASKTIVSSLKNIYNDVNSKKIIANKTKPTQIKSKSLEIKNGFQPYFEFENPKYLSFNNEGFEKHGTIDWIPSIYTNEDGTFEFTIPYFEQKEVLLNIQGIDNKGQLYFENITIEVK